MTTTRVLPAVVTIYLRKNGKHAKEAIEKTKQAISLFKSKGLKQTQISVVDLEPYPSILDWLAVQCNSVGINYSVQGGEDEPFPLIFIGENLIGGLDHLVRIDSRDKLGEQLSGFLNYVEGLERQNDEKKKKATWFGFLWGNGNEPPKTEEEGLLDEHLDFEEISVPQEKDEDDVTEEIEIEIWRTNWMWRQQKRVLRFSSDSFMRVDPTSRAVRQIFKYDSVDSVVVVSDTNVIIRFIDDTEPQYIQTKDSASRERLLVMLMNRATMHSGHFVHVIDERQTNLQDN